jgi:hypothetical protein
MAFVHCRRQYQHKYDDRQAAYTEENFIHQYIAKRGRIVPLAEGEEETGQLMAMDLEVASQNLVIGSGTC